MRDTGREAHDASGMWAVRCAARARHGPWGTMAQLRALPASACHQAVNLVCMILGQFEVGFVIHFLLWTRRDAIYAVVGMDWPFDQHPSLAEPTVKEFFFLFLDSLELRITIHLLLQARGAKIKLQLKWVGHLIIKDPDSHLIDGQGCFLDSGIIWTWNDDPTAWGLV